MKYLASFSLFYILLLGCRSNNGQDKGKPINKVQPTQVISYDTIIPVKDSSSGNWPRSLPPLKRYTLFGGKIEINLPANFFEMPVELMRKKYPSASRPSLIYTNEEGTINFTFKHTQEPCFPNALPQYLEKAVTQFSRISPEGLRSGIQKINGTDFIIIEFVSNGFDTKIYNLMYFTSLDAKIFMGTFNCIIKERVKWEPIAKHITQDVKISS